MFFGGYLSCRCSVEAVVPTVFEFTSLSIMLRPCGDFVIALT